MGQKKNKPECLHLLFAYKIAKNIKMSLQKYTSVIFHGCNNFAGEHRP